MALITNAALVEGPDGLVSPHSAVRREIIASAKALQARGVTVHVISLKMWPMEQVASIVERADFVIVGSMLERDYDAVYRDALRPLTDKRAVFIIGKPHGDSVTFYGDMAPLSHAWVAHSPAMCDALASKAACAVYSYPTPSESRHGTARFVRRGFRSRVAAAIAKRYRVGLDPWRVRLLWAGGVAEAAAVVNALAELGAFAARVPIAIECLTEPGSPLEQHATALGVAASRPLRLSVGERTVETVREALAECDAVILPDGDMVIDALHAGRFVIGVASPATGPFSAFGRFGSGLGDGLRWLLEHPREARRRVDAGQAYVARHHSETALASFWAQILGFASVSEAASLVRRSREQYELGDSQEAERSVARAIELDSGSADAHHLLGNILHDRATLDRAITCYRRALRLDPELAAAHNDLGTAYVAKGWVDEALECYSRAVQLDAESSTAHANLGQTLLKLGRRREALPHIRAATRARFAHLVRRTLKISNRRSMP